MNQNEAKDVDEQTQLISKFRQLHKKVCDHLERLVKASITKQIAESKLQSWSIGFDTHYGDNGEFDASIVQNSCVQFKGVKSGDGAHFIAIFKIDGKLKSLFEKYNQPTEFEITVDDENGDDYISISKERQIHALYGCIISYNCELSREGIDNYSKFVDALDKSLLFTLIE